MCWLLVAVRWLGMVRVRAVIMRLSSSSLMTRAAGLNVDNTYSSWQMHPFVEGSSEFWWRCCRARRARLVSKASAQYVLT